jgi:hypothetical protein
MAISDSHKVTGLQLAWSEGDQEAFDPLMMTLGGNFLRVMRQVIGADALKMKYPITEELFMSLGRRPETMKGS